MYYLHSEAKAKRLRLRLYREKGELELVVWYVAVLISDLSQHCVLRGPKRREARWQSLRHNMLENQPTEALALLLLLPLLLAAPAFTFTGFSLT